MAKPRSELLPGTLDMLVLRTLRHGHMHGYALGKYLRDITDQFFQIEEGTLYPALQRLERNGFIQGEWSTTPNGRRARFYRLTPPGMKQLLAEIDRYRQITEAITKVLGG